MLYKKEFWFAIFMLIAEILLIGDFVRNGFASYRLTGLILFPMFGIAFFKRALRR